MPINLVHDLLTVSLAQSASEELEKAKKTIAQSQLEDWEKPIKDLTLHRLIPLVFYSLKQHDLVAAIPETYRTGMGEAYHQNLVRNTFGIHTLAQILQAMDKKQVKPILWKGMLLADSFYPDLGTRVMGDIDFALEAEELEPATAVFQSIGFQILDEKTTEDAVYFANKTGILCDVHHRVRLFEGRDPASITIYIQPQRLNKTTFRVLEPNAMIAHLVVHLQGHRDETGIMLSWLVDIAFVLRKWGDRIQLERLQELMPQDALKALFRIVRLFEQDFREPIPNSLKEAAEKVQPLTLSELLRERRLALWNLSEPKGWVKLAACRLGLHSSKGIPYPYPTDLLLWSKDKISQLVAR
ncbi:nucleotidyltransferase domain-containing protein [Merismopedia glauca]|uniref:Nucleotidyltransferase family protein n=1 Tax=Merismopedia glauca CCAP 1448/3 TaxID=1296344 RepID=A0A2T1C1I2_9CYAN|nr:nucleotidyltransferase family protein [Merismopedia glauca]PSB02007.1 hypothetical protein C7B64_15275 [Merismopedia glauca CCAP 1448/3]